MNWKFWTWPAQIRQLKTTLGTTRLRLAEEEARSARILSSVELESPQSITKPLWSEPYDVAALRARLGQLPKDDKLFPLLAGYFDACVIGHADTKVSPDMTGQVVGRINALAELRTDWGRLWQDAHTPPKEKKS